MDQVMKDKLAKLKGMLKDMDSVVIAYSGGVDSTFLLGTAVDVLGDRALAVTATSSTYPAEELAEAQKLAAGLGARQKLIVSEELDIEGFADNPPNRCYYCKRELFSKLLAVAGSEGLNYVLDGTNYDDVGDHRPGMTAAKELGVRSPLKEAGLTKEDIRQLSRGMGLSTWDKPSFACLSTRFPYGTKITKEKLSQVDKGEIFLRSLGFQQFRIRHHGEMARIEISRDQFPLLLENAEQIVNELKARGFTYVAMDLQGYRTGSMNEGLPASRPTLS
ncbi:MAG TPA: ATP-dependent sacrificial sulfur transferase LarE [Spirochaetia bacterium]|nr:ATP-dependent sacrificial sulfur transferase LarE [Spirochaetia bacterium]